MAEKGLSTGRTDSRAEARGPSGSREFAALGARAFRASRLRFLVLLSFVLALLVACFASLDLRLAEFLSAQSLASMARFFREFLSPELDPGFLGEVGRACAETLAMSALGTVLAAVFGLLLALPAAFQARASRGLLLLATRALLNALRSVPELVWAALALLAAGLGPFAGTLALAAHTSGVLGRLFAEAIENAPPGPAEALRHQGVGVSRVFLYATFPQILPQLASYALYRWENNIRAASILGVVGAGGLGQLLSFHLGLFHMAKTSTILAGMLLLVAAVDGLSWSLRRRLTT